MQWKDKPKTRFTLRLPENLCERIKEKCGEGLMPISMNDYIIMVLFRSLDQNIRS